MRHIDALYQVPHGCLGSMVLWEQKYGTISTVVTEYVETVNGVNDAMYVFVRVVLLFLTRNSELEGVRVLDGILQGKHS